MDPAEQFRSYADECEKLAHATSNEDDQVFWIGMAEQWLVCSRLVELRRQQRAAPAGRNAR